MLAVCYGRDLQLRVRGRDGRHRMRRMRHSFFTKGREAYIKLLYALGGAGAETAADTAKSSKDEL